MELLLIANTAIGLAIISLLIFMIWREKKLPALEVACYEAQRQLILQILITERFKTERFIKKPELQMLARNRLSESSFLNQMRDLEETKVISRDKESEPGWRAKSEVELALQLRI